MPDLDELRFAIELAIKGTPVPTTKRARSEWAEKVSRVIADRSGRAIGRLACRQRNGRNSVAPSLPNSLSASVQSSRSPPRAAARRSLTRRLPAASITGRRQTRGEGDRGRPISPAESFCVRG
jgi:hypothetical protein